MSVQSIYRRHAGFCVYCGIETKLMGPGRNRRNAASRDHFIPLSGGGSKGAENQVLACQPCNSRKDGLDPRTVMQVWHGLNREQLYAFLRRLDEIDAALKDAEAARRTHATGPIMQERTPAGEAIAQPETAAPPDKNTFTSRGMVAAVAAKAAFYTVGRYLT